MPEDPQEHLRIISGHRKESLDLYDDYDLKHINIAFYQAVLRGFPNIAKAFLESGMTPEIIPTGYCDTALICAASYADVKTVKILLDYGADPNNLGKSARSAINYGKGNRSPLERPAKYGIEEVVKLLLEYGANPFIGRQIKGEPASIVLARENERHNVVSMLEAVMDSMTNHTKFPLKKRRPTKKKFLKPTESLDLKI